MSNELLNDLKSSTSIFSGLVCTYLFSRSLLLGYRMIKFLVAVNSFKNFLLYLTNILLAYVMYYELTSIKKHFINLESTAEPFDKTRYVKPYMEEKLGIFKKFIQ